jgi:uncharacterized protein YbcI
MWPRIKEGEILARYLDQMEATLKREITGLYKITFGKGPDDTFIRIFGHVILIRLEGALSQLEESLMTSLAGEEIVRKIRDELILEQASVYIPQVEKIVNAKVDKVNYLMSKNSETMYLFLLCERSIEEDNRKDNLI